MPLYNQAREIIRRAYSFMNEETGIGIWTTVNKNKKF